MPPPLPPPALSTLAYEALLKHLSRGESCFADILDPAGMQEFLHEASKRRLLTDTFVRSMCESGVPPRQLFLTLREIDVRNILKPSSSLFQNHHHNPNLPLPPPASPGTPTSPTSFSSISEMLFRTLSILSLNNFNELTYNFHDLNTLLHTCARNSQSLKTVSLTKLSQTITAGSIKSICTARSSLTALNVTACTISDGSFIETLASSGLALKSITLSKVRS